MRDLGRTPRDPTPLPGRPRGGAGEVGLVSALDTALRLAQLHSLENSLTQEALRTLLERLRAHQARHERLALVSSEGFLYYDELVLPSDDPDQKVKGFLQLLARHGLGGLVFLGDWDEAALTALLRAFGGSGLGTPEQRRQKLEQALELPPGAQLEVLAPDEGEAGLRAVSAMRSRHDSASKDQELNLSASELAAYTHARLRALGEAMLGAAREGAPLAPYGPALRLALTKAISALEGVAFGRHLEALTLQAPDPREPFAAHLANVTVHVLGMGRLLGLSPPHLFELAFAAFHHDLGRAIAGRQPASSKSEELRHTAEPHLVCGVALALEEATLDRADLLRLRVALEHHAVDGYPEAAEMRRPHLFSQLVGLADAFDRLENGTPWAPPLPPPYALRELATTHEPQLVELLRDLLGELPRGTLVALEDGRLAVVVDGGARRNHLPVVRILIDGDALVAVDDPSRLSIVSPQEVSVDWRIAALP